MQVKGSPLWDSDSRGWCVYLLHNDDDEVFFAGTSKSLFKRLTVHLAYSWPVSHVSYEVVPNKREAARAVRTFIKELDPAFNKAQRAGETRDFGQNLRLMREAQGKSLRQLAKELGISHTHLGFIETGKRGASKEVLDLLAEHLGVEVLGYRVGDHVV